MADLNRQLTELEALYEGTCTQLEKAVAERDAAVKALADHDARPQIASAPADDTSSEDDEFDDVTGRQDPMTFSRLMNMMGWFRR